VTSSGSDIPDTGGAPAASSDSSYSKIDTSVPHSARRYDYWLGGKDNFEVDRLSGDRIAEEFPTIRLAVLENRKFMRRVVADLSRKGFRQFLDIGTGIPTHPNLHEIAQAIAADSRIVYVDNDPLVMCHDRALLTSSPEGAVAYIEADLRDPDAILADPMLRETLDFGEPVALFLIAVLHFITDKDDAHACVGRLVAALPQGSVVVVSHVDETLALFNATASSQSQHGPFRARTKDEVEQFLAGLELLDPGVVSIVDWLPDQEPKPTASAKDTAAYGVVARLP
jgi:hypothetical protein